MQVSYEEFVAMAMGPPPEEVLEKSKDNIDAESSPGTGATGNLTPSVHKGIPKPSQKLSTVDEASEHSYSQALQDTIAKASSKEDVDGVKKRDPPIERGGRQDPPSGNVPPVRAKAAVETPRTPAADTQINTPSKAHEYKSRKPSSAIAYQQQGARASKIDDACSGFDRIQEKISQLKTLISVQQETHRQKLREQGEVPARYRSKQAPKTETLDQAFAKLAEVQAKMRALQALVKTNQM